MKYIRNRAIKRVLIIVGIPLALLMLILSPFIINSIRLELDVFKNERFLNRITILDGRHEAAQAEPNGDALTGSESPAIVRYRVDDTVGNVHREVSQNLSKQGYVVSSEFETFGLNDTLDEGDSTMVSIISTTATNGKSTLFIAYTLKATYTCPTKYGESQDCGPNIVRDAHLLDARAKELEVEYSPSGQY
jgi:hypothetical protein